MENAKIADKLVKLLDLRHEPVAVKVIKKGEKIPEGFNEPEKNIRHCQSIMRARKGESFVICSDAAANMICQRSEFEEESTIATVVGPLKEFKTKPDVVILVDLPETLYWLIPAATYFEGGRQAFSTAAFQATCVDSTIIPITSGEMNMSLGCYGCRRSTDIENDEMIAGIPYNNLEKIIEALEKISDGPMQKARQK
ncbi:MAG: hypothetical protein PWQ50_2162 [Methanolobus sp.]|nr:hypothetical protein [Methanolobus sp.]